MTGPALLAAYLKNNGLTLRDFASKVGSCAASVKKWRDGSSPTAKYLTRLRDVAGIPVDAWVETSGRKTRRAH